MVTTLQRESIRGGSDGQSDHDPTLGLLLLLSATAGSTDAIGFLGLNGLFTAHITGNIVLLANHLVASGKAGIAQMISVPVFMVAAGLARLLVLVPGCCRDGAAARVLLALQFALLLGFLVLSLALGRSFDVNSAWAVLAGMCGVAAMAVQNVLVQTSVPGSPSTAVLTTNVSRFTIASVEAIAGRASDRAVARRKVMATLPQLAGFITGCAAGGFLEWQMGLPALLLPVLLSLAAAFVSPSRAT